MTAPGSAGSARGISIIPKQSLNEAALIPACSSVSRQTSKDSAIQELCIWPPRLGLKIGTMRSRGDARAMPRAGIALALWAAYREIANEALNGSFSAEDHTLQYEIRSFKKLAGPTLPFLMKHAGIRKLETRDEMTTMVNALLMAGL